MSLRLISMLFYRRYATTHFYCCLQCFHIVFVCTAELFGGPLTQLRYVCAGYWTLIGFHNRHFQFSVLFIRTRCCSEYFFSIIWQKLFGFIVEISLEKVYITVEIPWYSFFLSRRLFFWMSSACYSSSRVICSSWSKLSFFIVGTNGD